jgi:hypothetical protein
MLSQLLMAAAMVTTAAADFSVKVGGRTVNQERQIL